MARTLRSIILAALLASVPGCFSRTPIGPHIAGIHAVNGDLVIEECDLEYVENDGRAAMVLLFWPVGLAMLHPDAGLVERRFESTECKTRTLNIGGVQ